MSIQFFNFCREVLAGASPWFVIIVLVTFIALRRSIRVNVRIGDSKRGRRRDKA